MMMRPFDDSKGIDLDISQVFDNLCRAFLTLRKFGFAVQKLGVDGDPPGLLDGYGDIFLFSFHNLLNG
jgi:hypothetical protein